MESTEKMDRYFEGLKKKALKHASVSALQGEVEEVKRWAQIAEECVGALQSLENLRGIASRVEGLLNVKPTESAEKTSREEKYRASREAGTTARQNWTKKVHNNVGVELTQISTSIFETPSHKRIGVGFGKENPTKKGQWFISMVDEQFDFFVFLCRNTDGTESDFVIPGHALSDCWQLLSRQNKQLKVNVSRSGETVVLHIPGKEHGNLDISGYLGRVDLLGK